MSSLKIGISASALYSLWQFTRIQDGIIPFPWFYKLSGYPVAQGLGVGGVFSTQRPYGWFPEPSFLAGALCLGLAALICCEKAISEKLTKGTWLILGLCLVAGIQTRSGVLIACLCPLLILALSKREMGRRLVVIDTILTVGIYFAVDIYQSRVAEAAWSWGDRWASTYGAIRFTFANWDTALVGIGRDSAAYLFARGSIPVSDLNPTFLPRGVYSILIRYIAEGGLIFGIVPLLFLLYLIYASLRSALNSTQAWCAIAIAVLVPLLAISYDTASVVWVVFGVFIGLSLYVTSDAQISGIRKDSLLVQEV